MAKTYITSMSVKVVGIKPNKWMGKCPSCNSWE